MEAVLRIRYAGGESRLFFKDNSLLADLPRSTSITVTLLSKMQVLKV